MSNLGPQQQNQTFNGIIQVPGGITSQAQTVQDGEGNNSALLISSVGVYVEGFIYLAPVAVASLPSAASVGAGAKQFVNNATATTFASIVTGGGSNAVPVYSDGTNWRIG